MSKFMDLTGQRFGRLTVVSQANNISGRVAWNCKCDCGSDIVVVAWCLRSGHTQSCGCYQREQASASAKIKKVTHGACIGSRTRLYRIWCGMKQRCSDTNCHSYSDYGGRGVLVCNEWRESFPAFRDWALKNGYEESLSIDRIDVNGNYEPANCRWANGIQQQSNRRTSVYYELNGTSKTLSGWADAYNIQYSLLWQRINRSGMNLQDALTRPARGCLCE